MQQKSFAEAEIVFSIMFSTLYKRGTSNSSDSDHITNYGLQQVLKVAVMNVFFFLKGQVERGFIVNNQH